MLLARLTRYTTNNTRAAMANTKPERRARLRPRPPLPNFPPPCRRRSPIAPRRLTSAFFISQNSSNNSRTCCCTTKQGPHCSTTMRRALQLHLQRHRRTVDVPRDLQLGPLSSHAFALISQLLRSAPPAPLVVIARGSRTNGSSSSSSNHRRALILRYHVGYVTRLLTLPATQDVATSHKLAAALRLTCYYDPPSTTNAEHTC